MSIAGEWYNELGSLMSIELSPDQPGVFAGVYSSRVGDATGTFPLSGHHSGPEAATWSAPLGWTVNWHNERGNAFSVTAWNGQYLAEKDRILATWLLTRSADAGDEWEATVIGQDVFQREKPSVEDVERSLRSGRPSPHPAAD